MYTTKINHYEVTILYYFLSYNNTPACRVYVPDLDIIDEVPQSIIEIVPN